MSASPIRDLQRRPVGALSISGPVARVPIDLLDTIGQRLKEAAAGIEERMGYRKAGVVGAGRAVGARA